MRSPEHAWGPVALPLDVRKGWAFPPANFKELGYAQFGA